MKPAAEEREIESESEQNSSFFVMFPVVLPTLEMHKSRHDHMLRSEEFAIRERMQQHSIAMFEMPAEVSLRVAISSKDEHNAQGGSSSHGETVGSPTLGTAPSILEVFPASEQLGTPI
ncbi:hypothetical protein Nepgr_019278 [Nepenthes gracilis]|uniref:Uncharacterized protein n=1 Tax=Nepenthes gracilis TaxID=150966 RepID=A0AAD3SUM9_NEPGR|nr:hypothetical protein Nepgr_019278 [Nepenthes gracilis]